MKKEIMPPMTMSHKTFPKRSQLWRGTVLRIIAHGISLIENPSLSNEVWWEKRTYTRQNTMGARGAITFTDGFTIGAFFDEHSSRNPFQSDDSQSNSLLTGIPPEQLSRLEVDTLQYLLDEFNGKVRPVFTSLFWSKAEYLMAAEPWISVMIHGGHLIDIETMDEIDALVALQREYEFSSSKMDLLVSLFTRKLLAFYDPLSLNKSEFRILTSNSIIGLEECQRLLETINIQITSS
jgi:hypothetical protein